MPENTKFEERYLVFVDILGWSNAVRKSSFDDLHKILLNVQDRCDLHSEEYKAELQKRKEVIKINQMFFDVKYTMFSDSIALSMPQWMQARICSASSELIREFLINGFLLRGGLVIGEVYQDKQTIFGKALIEAHDLESKKAKFSRILIDRKITNNLLEHDSSSIIRDHLGEYVIDPFPIYASGLTSENINQVYNLDAIIDILDDNTKNLTELDSLQKWEYMAKLCETSLVKFGFQAQKWLTKLQKINSR